MVISEKASSIFLNNNNRLVKIRNKMHTEQKLKQA